MKTAAKETVGGLVAETFEDCLRQVAKYEKTVRKRQDPVSLHQMRVQLRRLRTAMQVFAPNVQLPQGGSERQVAKVARQLGKLRDLDVIKTTLRDQYAPDLPDEERLKLEMAVEKLGKRQRKVHKGVKQELKGDRYRQLKSRLAQWTTTPDCNATAQLSLEMVLPDLLLPLLSRLWLHPGWLLGTKVTRGAFKPDSQIKAEAIDATVLENDETLHSLRKQIKRVRYQLKLVSGYYGDRLTADLTRFVELQDILGALQDGLLIEEFLATNVPNWQTTMPTMKSLLCDRRYRAWQQWQTHQQYFLNPKNRTSLHETLLYPTGASTPKQSTKTAKANSKSKASTKATSTQRKSRSAAKSKDAEPPRDRG
ncbi:MAG: CHAD domain-containing protein [Leptolyngbyaceae cyanobacterium]